MKEFVKYYKAKVKQNITCKEDLQFYYHFAKAIIMFDGHNKYRPLAVNILNQITQSNTPSQAKDDYTK